jgi:uncharacterized protein YdhG (YjbR/CyaY superfamily)
VKGGRLPGAAIAAPPGQEASRTRCHKRFGIARRPVLVQMNSMSCNLPGGGMTEKDNHDAYIAAAPEQFRAMLARLRMQLSRALPGAEEVMKYDMPGFQIEDTIVAGYAAFSKQCGLYVDAGAIAAHADEISSLKLKATKTGVTFSMSRPITDELVVKLAASSRSAKGF